MDPSYPLNGECPAENDADGNGRLRLHSNLLTNDSVYRAKYVLDI